MANNNTPELRPLVLGLDTGGTHTDAIDVACRIKAPLVLMGAPAAVLAPWLDRYLEGRLVVPPAFDVASAVGLEPQKISKR